MVYSICCDPPDGPAKGILLAVILATAWEGRPTWRRP